MPSIRKESEFRSSAIPLLLRFYSGRYRSLKIISINLPLLPIQPGKRLHHLSKYQPAKN
jgi:hypothetical protein